MWRAHYEYRGEKKLYTWDVDVSSIECPVSAITEQSLETLMRHRASERVHKASGGVLYGADASSWPARWYDAVSLIQFEIEREESARREAGLS